jgi:hypothetical protein
LDFFPEPAEDLEEVAGLGEEDDGVLEELELEEVAAEDEDSDLAAAL